MIHRPAENVSPSGACGHPLGEHAADVRDLGRLAAREGPGEAGQGIFIPGPDNWLFPGPRNRDSSGGGGSGLTPGLNSQEGARKCA